MSSDAARIQRIQLSDFRRFERYSISLSESNVLVGPNNAGKSTILDTLRALHGATRFAFRRLPTLVEREGQQIIKYDIPDSSIPIVIENIHNNYRDVDASILYTLDNGNSLTLRFNSQSRVELRLEAGGEVPRTTKRVRALFPISIKLVPTLGPFEQDEFVGAADYFNRWWGTRRSSRLFRGYWLRNLGNFKDFSNRVEDTWPGVILQPPELLDRTTGQLGMYYKEGRFDREVYWAGFGYQIWLQLITHILGANENDILVVDEPDIYLHPDLQRKLIGVIRSTGSQFVVATHSVEIINEADPDSIIVIERDRNSAKRVSDIEGLQAAVAALGSTQNIELSKLSRGRRIVFFEGKDFRILRRFASRWGYDALSSAENITIMPIEGINQYPRIVDAMWTFENILNAEVEIFTLFDRDFVCEEEIGEFVEKLKKVTSNVYITEGKEIENYLIVRPAIAKAIKDRFRLAGVQVDVSRCLEIVDEALSRAANDLRISSFSQFCSNRIRYYEKDKRDNSTILAEANEEFDARWSEDKISLMSGKKVLSKIGQHLQENHKISISISQISNHIQKSEVSGHFIGLLDALNEFSQ